MRPTEVPPRGVVDLADADVPDFLDAHALVLLAFLDGDDDACLRLHARLEVLAAHDPRAAFASVDVARHRLVADAMGVKSVPFLVVFKSGEVVDRLIGSPPDDIIVDVLRTRTG